MIGGVERASRQMLGPAQEEWLWDSLRDSAAAASPGRSSASR